MTQDQSRRWESIKAQRSPERVKGKERGGHVKNKGKGPTKICTGSIDGEHRGRSHRV